MAFKEGDKVWRFLYWWGVVTEIRTPIGVKHLVAALFGNTVLVFTQCGVGYAGQNQALFHDELKFLVPPEPKREVKFSAENAFDHEWQTSNGREVWIYATDGGGVYTVHGAAFSTSGRWWVHESWAKNGRFSCAEHHGKNLVHSPSCGCQ